MRQNRPEPGLRVVECSAYVAAERPRVFELLRRVEDFPRYMPNVLSVRATTLEDGRAMSAWETLLDGAPINWVEEDTFEPPRRMYYRMTEGDIASLEGEWLLEEAPGGGTRVTARIRYSLGVPIIEEVLGEMVQEKVRLNLEAMLAALARECGGG
jgi:ribosome-associated toxin RatA of RatAB toxin-antitoxin module